MLLFVKLGCLTGLPELSLHLLPVAMLDRMQWDQLTLLPEALLAVRCGRAATCGPVCSPAAAMLLTVALLAALLWLCCLIRPC